MLFPSLYKSVASSPIRRGYHERVVYVALATAPFLVGYFGTALDVGAYVPQIWRLLSDK